MIDHRAQLTVVGPDIDIYNASIKIAAETAELRDDQKIPHLKKLARERVD